MASTPPQPPPQPQFPLLNFLLTPAQQAKLFDAYLSGLNAESEKRLQHLEAEHQRRMDAGKMAHEAEMEFAQETHDAEMDRAKEAHERGMEFEKKTQDISMENAKDIHEAAFWYAEKKHESEMEYAKLVHEVKVLGMSGKKEEEGSETHKIVEKKKVEGKVVGKQGARKKGVENPNKKRKRSQAGSNESSDSSKRADKAPIEKLGKEVDDDEEDDWRDLNFRERRRAGLRSNPQARRW